VEVNELLFYLLPFILYYYYYYVEFELCSSLNRNCQVALGVVTRLDRRGPRWQQQQQQTALSNILLTFKMSDVAVPA
jgi:hypothetical protein